MSKKKQDTLAEEDIIVKPVLASDENTEALLRTHGIYYITGEIMKGSLKGIQQDILLKHYLGAKYFDGPITLVINSPGGDVEECNSLMDLLDNISLQVRTVGLGECSSGAAILLAAGDHGHRICGPNTTIMIHSYAWDISGKHHELVAARKAQDVLYQQDIAFWTTHSKYKTQKQVEKYILKKEDHYLTADDALRHGIIDKIGTILRR